MSYSARDRVKGILVGLAAGDSNGGPTRMALKLAQSLIQLERFDKNDVLQRYLTWWTDAGFDTGPVAAYVFTLISQGMTPFSAVADAHSKSRGLTAGCNPAHRSSPLAMAAFLGDGQLAECAYAEAALTHYDALAGDVAASVVILCRALIRQEAWPRAIQTAQTARLPATREAFVKIGQPPIYSGGFAPHVLKAALHFVQVSGQFEPALKAAIDFAGPANYCPVLVGAIGGARWGAEQIGSNDLKHCTILAEVKETAERLAKPWKD